MLAILAKIEIIETGNPIAATLNLNKDSLITDSYYVFLGFLVLSFVSFAANYFQLDLFNRVGEDVTLKLRRELFTSIVHKDMQFFDLKQNSPGVLASRLGKDCVLVNSAISTVFGAYTMGLSCVLIGLIVAYLTYWRLALLGTIGCPLIIIAGVIESKMVLQISTNELDSEEEKDNTFASDVRLFHEAVTKMKTVSSINCQEALYGRFKVIVRKDSLGVLLKGMAVGLVYGVAQATVLITFGVLFYAGAIFTTEYGLSFENLFRTLYVVLYASYGAGMAQNAVPDVELAKNALESVHEILSFQNTITYPKQGRRQPIKGRIEFRDVFFKYPTRENPVFKKLSFVVEPRQKVAFVGPSGTGKSTIYSLLYRFYDPQAGQILVDGVDVREYDIQHLRDELGMVAQEPSLFNATIGYSIRYNGEFSERELRDSAEIANANYFIDGDNLNSSPSKRFRAPYYWLVYFGWVE